MANKIHDLCDYISCVNAVNNHILDDAASYQPPPAASPITPKDLNFAARKIATVGEVSAGDIHSFAALAASTGATKISDKAFLKNLREAKAAQAAGEIRQYAETNHLDLLHYVTAISSSEKLAKALHVDSPEAALADSLHKFNSKKEAAGTAAILLTQVNEKAGQILA